MNLVALIGNVAAEPKVTFTPNGKTICQFRLAVSRFGDTEADFFDVITEGRQAEVCAEYLSVGRRVGIEGRLRQNVIRLDAETKRSEVDIMANRVQLLGAPKPTANV